MTTDLLMPALSPTMEEGTLAKWLVKPGDAVKPGDVLAEIETDKATMEFEAVDEGVILAIMVPEGTDEVRVGTPIARLGADGDTALSLPAPAPEHAPASELPPAPGSAPVVVRPTAPVPAAVVAPVPLPLDVTANGSPFVRKLAAARGIDLSRVTGTGDGGRVLLADLVPVAAVDLAPRPTPAAISPVAASPPEAMPAPEAPHRCERLSSMRRTIARRLTEAKQSVPHFYLSIDCRLDALLTLRARLNAELAPTGIKLSVNDLLLKALATALVDVPRANVQFAGDELLLFDRVDVAMAVAVDGGLVTPVIENVGARSISAIAREAKTLAARARDGSLPPEAYRGGTVSLSNLGMYGVSEMIPILNPPQAMILGVGAGEAKFVPDGAGGGIAVTMLRATGSFDHRAIDGATAAETLRAFRLAVENPLAGIL